MLRDEEFCMQTDSHMDVVNDWDQKLMEMWGRVNNEYGILTTYVHRIEQLKSGFENKKETPHLCQVWFARFFYICYLALALFFCNVNTYKYMFLSCVCVCFFFN